MMIELYESNSFLQKGNYKDLISHSFAVYGPVLLLQK